MHLNKSLLFFVLQILPVAVRNILDENVRVAIIKISRVFQRLCEKEIKESDEDEVMENVIMATCLLEKEFLTTFLNIMTHLPVHLVEQLFLCVQCTVGGCILSSDI